MTFSALPREADPGFPGETQILETYNKKYIKHLIITKKLKTHMLRLRQLPSQGMFPTPGPNDQHRHDDQQLDTKLVKLEPESEPDCRQPASTAIDTCLEENLRY